MRVINNRRLLEFAELHIDASEPLQAWRKVMEIGVYGNFAELRQVFRGVDKVGNLHIFNIAGNKYRIVVEMQYRAGIAWVKFVGTHAQYDKINVETVNEY